jgi:GAF domain-containing protein
MEEKIVEKIKRYYESLYQLAFAVNSAHTPEPILNSLVKNMAEATRAKGCSIMLLTPDRKELLHTAAYGLSDWYIRKGPVSADLSISEALEGSPVIVADAHHDTKVQYREQAKKEGIASILSVPMKLRGEIIGVVRVYSAEPRYFTNDDVYFVSTAANLGALALENARLYQSAQKGYDSFREEMLEWRAALGHEWMTGESIVPTED